MNLYEYEGKRMLRDYEVPLPETYSLLKIGENIQSPIYPCMAKAQLLQGSRAQQNAINHIGSEEELRTFISFLSSSIFNYEKVDHVLLEEVMPQGHDIYCSLAYTDSHHAPVLFLRNDGGTGIESTHGASIEIPLGIDTLGTVHISTYAKELGLSITMMDELSKLLIHLHECFVREDMTLLEVNPLRFVHGTWYALDAKITLDDRARGRHKELVILNESSRVNRPLSTREHEVMRINKEPQYGGSACSYIDLDGDIALMLSGGGASLIVFDHLIQSGITPGNYSEYSGNPSKEKVEALCRVIMSKPHQKGLFIAGAFANFTMIDQTMAGIASVLQEVKPTYPIVIRRDGPGSEEGEKIVLGVAALHGLDVTWLDPSISLLDATSFFIKTIS